MKKNIIIIFISLLVLSFFNTKNFDYNFGKSKLYYDYLNLSDTITVSIDVSSDPSIFGLITNFFNYENIFVDSNKFKIKKNQSDNSLSIEKPNKTNPVDKSEITNSLKKSKSTNSVDKPKITNSVDKPKITNPVDKPKITNPVDKPKSTNPVDKPKITNPVDKPKTTNPVDKPKTTNPVDKPKTTNPVEKPKTTNPVEKSDVNKKNENFNSATTKTSSKRVVRKKIKKVSSNKTIEDKLPSDRQIIEQSTNISNSAKKLILKLLDEKNISMLEVEDLLLKHSKETIKKKHVNEILKSQKKKRKKRN